MRPPGSALLLAASVVAASCARRPPAPAADATPGDSGAAIAIARDRPERLVLPLAPPGAGTVVYVRVSPARATLELPPPPAEVAEPPAQGSRPASEAPAASGGAEVPPAAGQPELKPPIPRGIACVPSGGRGGSVTLDVRVDENGEVSDVLLVGSDADSLTVRAASEAARAVRYHPALLGDHPVAVWTRQVFDVKRGRRGLH